jgi:hypothetical protein
VRLSPLGTAATTGLVYQPQMIDDGDCGAIGGMKIGRGNRSTRRKPAPAPLCPPQIPHDLTREATTRSLPGLTMKCTRSEQIAEKFRFFKIYFRMHGETVMTDVAY